MRGFREPFRQAESSPQCGAEILASSAGPATIVLDVHRSLQPAPRPAPGALLIFVGRRYNAVTMVRKTHHLRRRGTSLCL